MSLSLADLKDKLPNALVADVPQDVLSAVLAAERTQQRSIVRGDSPRPSELDRALVARVRHNLEQGIPTDVADVARRGGASAEVRDLEAPFSRRVTAAARAEAAAAPAGRPAKKTTAKKAAKRTAKKAAKKAPAKKAAASTTKTAAAAPAPANQAASPASTEGN
jgi:hypothetical protein